MFQDELKDIIGVTASLSTILQFLSGTLVCMKIVQNNTTGDLSAIPFISGCLSTSLWLRYGFMINDTTLILVNTTGSALFLAYTITFLLYSIKRTLVIRQVTCSMVAIMLILVYVQQKTHQEAARTTLGIICCLVTILFFAAPLASFMHVIRVKNTESLPLPLILTSFIVAMQWHIYGVLLKDKFIQVPNLLGSLLSGFQLILFCIYPSNSHKYSAINELI